MDGVAHVRSCLAKWSEGGSDECRSFFIEAHSTHDASSIDTLASAYQTLIHSALQRCVTTFPKQLSADALVAFVKSISEALPSTSASVFERSHEQLRLGELLVDLAWAVDSELEEIISEAKIVLSPEKKKEPEEDGENAKNDQAAERASRMAESDRGVLSQMVRSLVNLGIVDVYACRERLDSALLSAAGLLHDKAGFDKKEIRIKTALFFKQRKFNLLREQSEGYTKLSTELFNSLGPPNDPATASPIETYEQVQVRAQSAWTRVMGLIGSFDLDPNRCLDIILDVFSVNITTHWQFFLALLAWSPWAGANTTLEDWSTPVAEALDDSSERYRGKGVDEILRMAASEPSSPESSTAGPEPNILAQVLGFKFRHYQSPETSAPCTRGLYLVAALLIRGKFISFEDLYPHLGPAEEDLPAFHQKYLDGIKERIKSSSNNLLAMAAPLESGGSSMKTKSASEEKPVIELKEQPPQKAMIVVALLSVGVLRPAVALLVKYPWLVDIQKDIADLLIRALKVSIEPLFKKLHTKEHNQGFSKPRERYASPGVMATPTRKSQLTLCAPPPPSTHNHDCIFFYPQWSKTVPICQKLDDLMDVVEPLMRLVGVHISREPVFIAKLCRLGRSHLLESIDSDSEGKGKQVVISEPDNEAQEFWLAVVRRHLLPALSMMAGNAVCTVDVWTVLRFFDVDIRWRIYGEWRDSSLKLHPELNMHRILREREAKGILRRLASQTIEALSGTVGKMVHTNPLIFFTNAVNQIQAYDNLGEVVIQSIKSSTNMGFDILHFVIFDALANPNKERLKEDGANASDWLQSLATFAGAFFRRYGTDLSSGLKYIVHQLYNGQTSEIIVLEKIILRMAGIEPLPSLSDQQISAMAGGPILRIEAVASNLRGAGMDVSESAGRNSMHRLGKTLVDTKLALPMFLQIAQQRQACVFKARDAHLKSIAYLFDATHGVLFQYLDLLTTPAAVPMDDYRALVPSLMELVSTYGIHPEIAMQLLRPMLNCAITKHSEAWSVSKAEEAKAQELRLKAALAAKRDNPASAEVNGKETGISSPCTPNPAGTKMEVDQQENGLDVKMVDNTNEAKPIEQSPWIPELALLFDECRAIVPQNVKDILGPAFYVTFWQLSSYDLYFPKEKYIETEKSLLSSAESLLTKARQAERSSDKSIRSTSNTLRAQKDRYSTTATDLKKERQAHEIVVRYTTDVDGRIEREKAHWFSHVRAGKVPPASLVQTFIEYCITPRALLSPMDAVFCSRLIRTLHERGTPGFHTLQCYNQIMQESVKVVIFSCSENEARNYGRFLKGILQDLNHWHKNEAAYDSANRRTINGVTILLPGFQGHWSKDGPTEPTQLLSWQGLKSFMRKGHRKLNQAFTDCFQAGDFMRVYNSILVLKEIIEVFPLGSVNDVVGASLDHEIQRLVQTEERGDLKILARAYASSLKKREKYWAMTEKNVPMVKSSLTRSSSKVGPTTSDNTRASPSPAPILKPSHPNLPVIPEKAAMIERPSSASRLDLESIPRPEVVKRIRDTKQSIVGDLSASISTADKASEGAVEQSASSSAPPGNAPNGVMKTTSTQDAGAAMPSPAANRAGLALSRSMPTSSIGDLRKEILQKQDTNGTSRPGTPQLPVHHLESSVRKDSRPSSPHPREGDSPIMAPPSEPSQTASAQELRSSRRVEKGSRDLRDNVSEHPSRSRRSRSPSSRPGTRSTSVDSRASSSSKRGRSRREKIEATSEDSKRPSYIDVPSRAERGGQRESRSERSGRDRIPGSSTRDTDRERDSDRERGRERDRAREKERERERDRRDRGERESHRDRDREKDKHREERHRRDHDRDRDRERERDRERKPSGPSKEADVSSVVPSAPRLEEVQTRTPSGDPQVDDVLGKRRRPLEDETDRSAKRGSRHHRSAEKAREDVRDNGREVARDSDRRRKDRDSTGPEGPPAPHPGDPVRGTVPSKDVVHNEEQLDHTRDSAPPTPTIGRSNPPSGPRAMVPAIPRTPREEQSPQTPTIRDLPPAPKEREDDGPKGDKTLRTEPARNDRESRNLRPERERDEREREYNRRDRIAKDDRERIQPREAAQNESSLRPSLSNGVQSPSISSLADRISAAPVGPAAIHRNDGQFGREEPSERLKRSNSDRDKEIGPPPSGGSQTPKGTKKPRIDRHRLNHLHRTIGVPEKRR